MLWLGVRASFRFRLQALLVLLASLAGVTATIASSAYAQSGTRDIVARYEALGARMIAISPIASRAVGGRARTGSPVTTLSLADNQALRRAEPDVTAASATVTSTFRLRAGDLNKSAVVVGCDADYFEIKHWRTKYGGIFSPKASRRSERVALLGTTVALDLFGKADPTGSRLLINRVPFIVSGVLEERGRRIDGSDEDDQVYVPLSAAMRRLMNVDHLGGILLQARQSSSVPEVARIAGALLARRHKRFGGQQPDFTITDQQLILADQLAAFRRFSFFVDLVSLSALGVCATGITGICWISINGRRRDIGAMRAMGATPGDVLLLFLVESATPVVFGCVAGLASGYVLASMLEAKLRQGPWFDWGSALFDSGLCALLFGIAIAGSSRRASRIVPALALSGE